MRRVSKVKLIPRAGHEHCQNLF